VVNSKVYAATKVLLFIANYRRELRIRVDIKRKRKVEKAMEFVERIKRVEDKVEIILKKIQE